MLHTTQVVTAVTHTNYTAEWLAFGPAEIVVRAWAEVEQALLNAGEANGIRHARDSQVMLMLMDAGKLRAETVALIESARHIRNKLAHGGREPGYTDAILYLTSSQTIAQAIARKAGS